MSTVKIVTFKPELCDDCRECEKACSNVHFKNSEGGQYSAIRITEKDGAYSMSDCNHCGLCIDVCPSMAIKRLGSGTVVLRKKECVGCQSCVAFCARGVMRKAEGHMNPFKCISCGKCVEACPEGALALTETPIEEVWEIVYHQQGVK